MPENKIVHIVTREFMKLVGEQKLEVGDIIRESVYSKGEIVIDTLKGLTTLKAESKNGKVVPVKTRYEPIKEINRGSILSCLGLEIPIDERILNKLYFKMSEYQWDINVRDYFKDYHAITESKLKEVGLL